MRLQRDALGQLTHEELAPGLNRQLRYNSDGLLTEQSLHAGQQGLFATRYDYDRAGNLTSRHDSAFGKDTYLYDPMGRILKHTDPQGVLHEFFNDPAGDRLITQVSGSGSASTVVGRNDEWLRQGSYQGTHYRFDRAGNLTHKQDSQQRLELAWDANQRLIASRRTTKEAPPSVTTYGYDPLGRRLFKETQGQRTWFGWDGDAMTLDVIDGQAREFIYRPETFEPLAVLGQTARGQQLGTLHYVNDPNGCPTRLIDGKGQVLWAASYSAWGAVDKLHASAVSNPIRLQGQYEDGETGLYYNRYRYYDTTFGAFVSSDPLGQIPGENIYSFGLNTSRWIDPIGLSCTPTHKNRFPSEPDEMTALLGVQPKKIGVTPDGTRRYMWEPNSSTRIRFESHPEGLQPGDIGFNPRHHGEHYHIETKPSGMSWNQAKNQGLVTKAKPQGYTPGSGTGFLPGEPFP
jgi:RHS repeat-associated protein